METRSPRRQLRGSFLKKPATRPTLSRFGKRVTLIRRLIGRSMYSLHRGARKWRRLTLTPASVSQFTKYLLTNFLLFQTTRVSKERKSFLNSFLHVTTPKSVLSSNNYFFMKETFKKLIEDKRFKYGIAILLIAIGIFSLVTPLTPGSWLALIGLEILGIQFLSRKKLKEYYERVRDYIRERLK